MTEVGLTHAHTHTHMWL